MRDLAPHKEAIQSNAGDFNRAKNGRYCIIEREGIQESLQSQMETRTAQVCYFSTSFIAVHKYVSLELQTLLKTKCL